jgi:hypothetical protein
MHLETRFYAVQLCASDTASDHFRIRSLFIQTSDFDERIHSLTLITLNVIQIHSFTLLPNIRVENDEY